MQHIHRLVVIGVLLASGPSAAFAQRFPFERTIQVSGPTRLDVATDRGRIEVVPGAPGRVVVEGTATVRVGWNVPANAPTIARQVAAAPPVEYTDEVVRLRVPADPTAQLAVTVNYRVEVPPGTEVRARSGSGATSLRGIDAAVDVRTQSAAIDVGDLTGAVQISTGSGDVRASRVMGALDVTTSSSAITLTGLGSSLRVRTRSGAVNAVFTGSGDVDVETGSSSIQLTGVRGGLVVTTQSGRVSVQGTPARDWQATTGSSAVSLELGAGAAFRLDAESRSGNVEVVGAQVTGSTTKHAAQGAVGRGGPTVRIRTGSGLIRVARAGG